MDEVSWGPGSPRGSEVPADRSRSAVLLARLGRPRRSKLRRLSVTLTVAGFLAVAAAQLAPWAHLAMNAQLTGQDTGNQTELTRNIGIADGQTILQFSYYITVALMLALCGGAAFASGRSRRLAGGTALGAVGGHLLLLLPLAKTPARLYGYLLDNNFGDGGDSPLKVARDLGMWLGVGGTVLLGVAIGLGLLTDRLPDTPPDPGDPDLPPDAERLSDHDRPSTHYRPADAVETRPTATPARTPANQFAFEGHADLPVEADAPSHPDHSIYQRPRHDSDLRAR